MPHHEHGVTVTLIDRHFAGRIDPEGERRMREDLGQCASCKSHYQRHLLFAKLDPGALDAKARLRRGLGLGQAARSHRFWATAAATAVATAAVVVVFPRLMGAGGPVRSSEFGARGGSDEAVRLFVHRLSKNQPPERLGKKMAPSDELAFSYQNPGAYSHLVVFAVDRANRVYWYHPAWTDPANRPSAISIEAGAQTRELPEAVRHALPPGPLRIYGVFARRSINVADVEGAVTAAAAGAGRLPLEGTVQVMETVEVAP
jgi:hypothetical protein